MGLLPQTRRRAQRFRCDEAFEPTALGMQLAPVVEGEIDDNEAGCRQLFPQPLSSLHVAGRDQHHREIVKARIVPNNQKRMRGRCDFLYDSED